MAQIKKFQSGGKFYWGDQELTPEQIQDFSKWAASNSSKVGNVASAMLDAYRSGKTVTFDPVGRSVTGIDNFDAYSKRGNKEAQKANRRNSAVQWGALFNSDATQLQNQIYNVGDWTIPVKQVEPEKPKEKVKFDFTNELTLPYKKGNDGTYTFSDAYVVSQIQDRFKDYTDYLKDKDKYELVLGTDLDDFEKYYTAKRMEDLTERFESGMLSDQDIKDIQRFGVIFGTPAVTTEQQAAQQQAAKEKADALKKEIAETYNPTGWAEHGIIVGTDANGNITVSGDKYNPNVMYYLGDFSPINSGKYYGGLLYNGKFYTNEEFVNNPELLAKWSPAKSMIEAFDWSALTSNPNFNVFYGKEVPFTTYQQGLHWLDTPGYVHPSTKDSQPTTGTQVFNAYNTMESPRGYTAYGFMDRTMTPDVLGFRTPQYVMYDENAKQYVLNPTPKSRGYVYVGDNAYNDYIKDLHRYNGTDYAILNTIMSRSNPEEVLYTIYRNTKDGRLAFGRANDKRGRIYAITDQDSYEKLIDNPYGLTDSEIEKLIEGRFIYDPNAKITKNQESGSYLGKGGIRTREKMTKVKNNAYFKLGGILKHQWGGDIQNVSKDSETKGFTKLGMDVDFDVEDTSREQFASGDLTVADKTELAAIGADVAGALTSLIPGYGNIAGAGLGLVGTGTQFAADVRRDGLDWGDVGRGIAGVSLDVLGLVPIAGSSAKMVKVAKTIQRGANAIGKLFAVTGFAAGAASLKNIVSGDFDISDIRNVATGLQSTMGLGRLGRSRYDKAKLLSEVNTKQIKTSGQPVSSKKLSVKFGDEPVEIEITKADYEAKGITDKYSKENNKKLQDLIVEKVEAKFKSQNKDFKGLPKETKDDILSKVTVDGKPLESKSRFKLFGDESYVLDAPKDQTLEKDVWKLFRKSFNPKFKFQDSFAGKLEGFKAESDAAKRALDDLSIINPELFGDTYKNGKNWTDIHIGWRMFRNPNKKPVVTSTAPKPVAVSPNSEIISRSGVPIEDAQVIQVSTQRLLPSPRSRQQVIRTMLPNSSAPSGKVIVTPYSEPTHGVISLPVMSIVPNSYVKPYTNPITTKYLMNGYAGSNTPGYLSYFTHPIYYKNPQLNTYATKFKPVIIEPDGQFALFKKGGKVIKAQYAIPNGFPKTPNLGEINRTKGQEASMEAQQHYVDAVSAWMKQNPGYELIDGVPYKMDIDPATVSANANTSLSVLIPNEWKQSPMKMAQERVRLLDTNYQPNIIEENISESISTPQKTNFKFYGDKITTPSIGSNLLEHALRFGKFGSAIAYSNKVRNENKKSLRDAYTTSLLKPVSEEYSPFNTFGTDIIGAEQERRLRRVQPITADGTLANALQLEANDRADAARAQYMSQIAGQYATNAERNAELRRQYAQHRADIANKNAQMLGDLKLKLGAEDAQHTSRVAQSVENLFGEYQTLLSQDKAIRSAFDQQLASANLQKATFAKKQDIMDKIKKAYIAKNPTDTTYSGLTSTWMNENTPELALQYQSTIPDSMNDLYSNMYNNQMNFSWNKIKSAKHGGTLESNKDFVQLLNKLKHEI